MGKGWGRGKQGNPNSVAERKLILTLVANTNSLTPSPYIKIAGKKKNVPRKREVTSKWSSSVVRLYEFPSPLTHALAFFSFLAGLKFQENSGAAGNALKVWSRGNDGYMHRQSLEKVWWLDSDALLMIYKNDKLFIKLQKNWRKKIFAEYLSIFFFFNYIFRLDLISNLEWARVSNSGLSNHESNI